MTNEATSFWKFIGNYQIEIPIIQRDYAQGRLGKEYLRNNFLGNLKQALDHQLLEPALKLDFVYGSEDEGKLSPLDGQQRLTTLWLLHWYVALRAGKLEEASVKLRNFTYETRISSREFCRNLCIPQNFEEYGGNIGIVDFITSRTWFYSSWKQDPTIQSMLRMIGGTKINNKRGNDIIDGLEGLFNKRDKENFEKYWKALTSENAPIVFYYLPLKDFGLTDDLYIKMNARGKQLTPFENFKADFIEYIEEKAKKYDAWSRFLGSENEKGIPLKLDTEWTDVFWRSHDVSGDIDRIFFAFLNRYFLNCAIIYNGVNEALNEWKLYGNKSDDSSLGYDSGFSIYAAILSRPEVLENLSSLFEHLSEVKKEVSEYLPQWFGKFDFIPRYTDSSISKLTQAQRVVFFGICRYLESCTSFNETHFRRWMRVVCNLVENTTINTIDAMIGRMKLINELSAHAEDIYEYLSNEETEIHSTASQEQLTEEIEKARQILKPQEAKRPEKPNDWNEEKAWDWEAAIIEAERYAIFNGAIRFLFRNKNGEWDWNGYSKKWGNALALFGENGLYKNKSALLRYFISKFTKSYLLWGITFDNTPSSWRSSLLNEKWNDPVDEMLRSSSFEVEPDFNSTFDGKLKAVQEELVLSNLLDYIERGCHLNCRNNDIYILYPYNAKADWKKYIIADKRNIILSSIYGGRIDMPNKLPGKIYTNQKIEGCEFFWGWDIHFIYVLDDAKYTFRWQNRNSIDMYDGDKRLCEDDNKPMINGDDIKDGADLIEKMNQCIARYLNAKRNANQLF